MKAVLADFLVSWRNVLRHGHRTFAGLTAVGVGTMALILAGGFIEHSLEAMREGHIYSGLGHIQIVRPGYLERGASDPFRYLLPKESTERRAIERSAHVVSVAPRLKFTGLISYRDSALSFLGRGLDPDREVAGEDAILLRAGEPLSKADIPGIHLGAGLASNLGVKVGDVVVLLANTRDGGLNGVEARVKGIFVSVTKAYDDVAVHVVFDLAANLLRVDGAHNWVVYLDETANTPSVLADLKPRLGDLQAVPWYEMADFYNKTVRLFSRQVWVMNLLIAFVVVFAISNMMMRSVLERTDEIATSMALGVERKRVLRRFLFEGTVIGCLGGIAGVALGYLLAKAVSTVGIPMPPPPGMSRGYINRIAVTPPIVWHALLLAVSSALVASVFPAWKASRMVIAEALRRGR